jgi:secretion/DNA translocation related TadE-like protein
VTGPARDRGAVTVLVLAVLVFGLLLAVGVSRLGVAIIGRARADTAADAAALAAADALALGEGTAAAVDAARVTAASNGARLVSCECSGTTAAVVVDLDLGVLGSARGRARAVVELRCAYDPSAC